MFRKKHHHCYVLVSVKKAELSLMKPFPSFFNTFVKGKNSMKCGFHA